VPDPAESGTQDMGAEDQLAQTWEAERAGWEQAINERDTRRDVRDERCLARVLLAVEDQDGCYE
jgi:hypothetical protein